MRVSGETFQRKPLEMFYSLILSINTRPLTLSHHPHVKDMLLKSDRIITPLDLHYGRQLDIDPLSKMQGDSNEEKFKIFREKWDNIMSEYNRKQDEELALKNELKKRPDFQVGDLCYVISKARHKEDLKYIKNIYEITQISHDKCHVKPLFKSSEGETFVNLQDIKKYDHSHLFELLPLELRSLLGEVPTPDEI